MAITVDIQKQLGAFRLDVRFSAENEVLSLLGASGGLNGRMFTVKTVPFVEEYFGISLSELL